MPRRAPRRRPARTSHWRDFEHGTYIDKVDATHFRIYAWDRTKTNPRTGRPGVQVTLRASGRTPAEAEAEALRKARLVEERLGAGATAIASGTVRALAEDTKANLETRVAARTISARYRDKIVGAIDTWVLHPEHGIGDVRLDRWVPAVSEDLLNAARAHVGPDRVQTIGQAMRVMVTRGQATRVLLHGAAHDPLHKVRYTAKSKDHDEQKGHVDRDQLPTLHQCSLQEKALGAELDDAWRVMLRLKRESMVRYSELLALTPADFTFTKVAVSEDVASGDASKPGELIPWREVRVWRALEEPDRGPMSVKATKSDARRASSFSAELAEDLEALVEEVRRTRGDEARILVRDGGPQLAVPQRSVLAELGFSAGSAFFAGGAPDRKWFGRKWLAATKAAGLPCRTETTPQWTVHDWRHVGSCWWLFDLRADPGAVRYAGGWHSVAFMLATYTSQRGSAIGTLTRLGA